jgi:hypothetical protein
MSGGCASSSGSSYIHMVIVVFIQMVENHAHNQNCWPEDCMQDVTFIGPRTVIGLDLGLVQQLMRFEYILQCLCYIADDTQGLLETNTLGLHLMHTCSAHNVAGGIAQPMQCRPAEQDGQRMGCAPTPLYNFNFPQSHAILC